MTFSENFLFSYLRKKPDSVESRYIFLVSNADLAFSIIDCGFKAVALSDEFGISEFKDCIGGTKNATTTRQEYIFVPACATKKENDALEEFLDTEYLRFHPGWMLFKNKEYLANFSNENELKGILSAYIQRFEGNSDNSKPDLMQFHLINDKGVAVGVFDAAIEEYIINNQKLFIYGGIPFLYKHGCYFPDFTKAELSTAIREKIFDNLIKSTTINRVYRLFLTDARIQKDFEEINAYPAEWICFRNGMYDPINKKMMPHDDKYCCINQVPHEYHPEMLPKAGKAIEEYLDFICDGKQDTREMLLQYMGYSLTRDTRQQKFLILTGKGVLENLHS